MVVDDVFIVDGVQIVNMEVVCFLVVVVVLVFGFGYVVGVDWFDGYCGGMQDFYQIVNDVCLLGIVSDNVVVNVVMGLNIVCDGLFVNVSGIFMVIQNSGVNVLIQNVIIVNVQFWF